MRCIRFSALSSPTALGHQMAYLFDPAMGVHRNRRGVVDKALQRLGDRLGVDFADLAHLLTK